MKQTAVEWLVEQMLVCNYINKKQYYNCKSWLLQEAKETEEELKLELVHKFVFDHTYNYRGNKTLYEYVDEWYEEYKRLNNL